MQWNLKKTWLAIAASTLLTTSFTYATANSPTTSNTENCFTPLKVRPGMGEMINLPAMPLTRNGWDFQVSADALLWQLQEDGFIYSIETTSLAVPVKVDRAKQKYNWGFRIGLDWTLPHDNWDIAASWTHLISNRLGKSTAAPGNLLTKSGFILSSPVVGFTIANARYHNRLDQISLNTGREFFISKWVTLRPFFGLRTDWLNQRLRASYSGIAATPTLTQIAQRKIKWWGIGIESGLNTQWSFCGGFSLYGNIATAIEYGLQKLHVNESGIIADSFKDSYHICIPIIDLQLGLGWDYNFCNDRLHLGVKLGWENHVYFTQSHFFSPRVPQGNLTYQGWTLHTNFDF